MTRAEFTNATKLAAWHRAAGRCEQCGSLLMGKFRYDHINPCAFAGEDAAEAANCQVLCPSCHDAKTYQHDIPAIAKSNRVRLRHAGIHRSRNPIRGGRLFDGSPVRYPRAR